MDKKSQKNFQQRPAWIFFTVIILLIPASSDFSELFLDYFPSLFSQKKYIQLGFIGIGFFLLFAIYWKEEKKYHDPDPDKTISENERRKRLRKQYKWYVFQYNIFKRYPLNVITFKIIPIFICWIISLFINKKHKPYLFHPFDFPKEWSNYDYEDVTSKFFKIMFRVYTLDQDYEVKFKRDFQYITIRCTPKNEKTYGQLREELYEKIFSEDQFKHIKIFTWIFPFGLYWNLRRILICLKQKK